MHRRKLRYSHEKRNRSFWKIGILCLVFFSGASGSARPRPGSPVSIPEPEDHIVDPDGLLPSSARRALENRLALIKDQSGCETILVIFSTAKPENIYEFASRALETLKPGWPFSDGAIIVVLANTRRARLLVRGSIKERIPERSLRDIAEYHMEPALNAGTIQLAADSGLALWQKLLERNKIRERNPAPLDESITESTGLAILGVALLAIGLVLSYMAARWFFFFTLILSLAGATVLFLETLLFSHSLLVAGLVALFLAVHGGRYVGRAQGLSGSGFGGSGFGGGFSGGGGSFGGGGASGGW